MPRELSYSRLAAADIAAVRGWLRQPGSGARARRRLQAILAAIEGLRMAPCRYRPGDDPTTRRLTVERHVVIYEVRPDTGNNATAGDVHVLRVFAPGQQQTL